MRGTRWGVGVGHVSTRLRGGGHWLQGGHWGCLSSHGGGVSQEMGLVGRFLPKHRKRPGMGGKHLGVGGGGDGSDQSERQP